MKLNLDLFDMMFPTYRDFRVPMWSDWKDKEDEMVLKVAVPGYEKSDFKLYIEDNTLYLKIEPSLLYSIIDSPKHQLDKAKAEYVNGILKLSIPKKKTKRTEIEVL